MERRKATPFDVRVGKVAGAVFTAIRENCVFPEEPIHLIPPITFKVKRTLERFPAHDRYSEEDIISVSREIENAIIPVLFTYELDPKTIETLSRLLGDVARRTLKSPL